MKLEGYGPARVDLLASDQRFAEEDLPEVNPDPLTERLRVALYREGARSGTGWLHGALHVEFDLRTRLFDVHLHGTATGSCLTAVDALRGTRRYAHARAIQVSRKPLTDPDRALTYTRQGFGVARDRSFENPARERIPEPAHSLFLLWLHRWPAQSMELMIGLRVVRGRLVAR